VTRQITVIALFENEGSEQANLLVTGIEKLLASAGMYVCMYVLYVSVSVCIVSACLHAWVWLLDTEQALST